MSCTGSGDQRPGVFDPETGLLAAAFHPVRPKNPILPALFIDLNIRMGRSQESFSKKEREKKKRKKKKEKREKYEQRKKEESKGIEFMYVDADGNLTSTPPEDKKPKVKLEDIEISVPKKEYSEKDDFRREGRLKFFNAEKGYGFIQDSISGESYFVHINSMDVDIVENDQVTFDVGKGPKGPVANNVRRK